MSADHHIGAKTAAKAPAVGIAFLVSQFGAHAAKRFAEELSELELKPYDAGILRLLGANPGLTQQILSDLLGVFPSQLVALLDALETRRLIERRDNPADRRSYQLYLSKKGGKTLKEIAKLTLRLEDDLFSAMNQNERSLLQHFLTRMVEQQRLTPRVHPAYRQVARP